MIHVGRDPFARAQYHKTIIEYKSLSYPQFCDWCGAQKKKLFKYTWEEDQHNMCPPRFLSSKKFCNLSCFKSYYS